MFVVKVPKFEIFLRDLFVPQLNVLVTSASCNNLVNNPNTVSTPLTPPFFQLATERGEIVKEGFEDLVKEDTHIENFNREVNPKGPAY